jgi:Uma2 family endonuclease
VMIEERLEIPFVRSLDEFRAWAVSDDFPEQGRIDYIAGRIEVDMSPEDLLFHGVVKTTIIAKLETINEGRQFGLLLSDRTRISSPEADLSCESDVVLITFESLRTGRVRLVPKAGGEADRYVEVEGPADLIVEIVSDGSVTKDTKRLPMAYWRAGVPDFWLIDARGKELFFQIYRLGTAGYEAVAPDENGFQSSAVFGQRFRLVRHRNVLGYWSYELQARG